MSFDIAVRYELGVVIEPLPGDDRFRGMLSIPYLSNSGVTALKFRNMNGDGAKYAQHNGQKGRLYNAPAYFAASDTVGIAEGELDAIAATEHLGVQTLGVPGANGWQDLWTPLFRDFTRVLVFADGDQPGRDFANFVAEKIGWRAQVIRCPEGEDISSLAASDSLDVIQKVITTSNEEEA